MVATAPPHCACVTPLQPLRCGWDIVTKDITLPCRETLAIMARDGEYLVSQNCTSDEASFDGIIETGKILFCIFFFFRLSGH